MSRGIPQIFSTYEIKHNLLIVWFEVIFAALMHKKIQGTRTDLLLILTQFVNTVQNRNIFNLTNLGVHADLGGTPEG